MQRRSTYGSFAPLASLSHEFMTRMGWETEIQLADLRRLWSDTLGDPIARVSYPFSLSETEIVIACLSPLWKRELSFLEEELRDRLGRRHPTFSSRPFVFRVVRPFRKGSTDKERLKGEGPKIEALWKEAEKIASRLPPALRERGRTFVLSQLLAGAHLGLEVPQNSARHC
ncbi:MAG: DUF721 domain-containing protein [Leptospirillia bacterium]